MTLAPVNPEILRWARERAGVAQEELALKFKRLPEWEDGQSRPTLKQAEAFARALHVPVGYLFLSEPPEEALPIPDFRTFAGHAVMRPSPNLLDTIYACQERQSWYREFARVVGARDPGFVGSASVNTPPATVAAQVRETLGFDLAARRECPTWIDALRLFIRQADEAGVLVMVSGIVMSNNHRHLNPAEFRGFALCRSACAADLRQWQGHEGGADVHARPRARTCLAWRFGLVESRRHAGVGLPPRGGVVQRGGSGASGAAGCSAS